MAFRFRICLLAVFVAGASAREPLTYRNPVIPGFHPDPSICRVGEDYYLVTSSFEYFPGVPIFHSRDLVHWRIVGHCLTRKSQLNLDKVQPSRGIFAPTLRYHDGTFYMITTHVTGGGNFYVTSPDPRGPWSDPIWVDDGLFDPSLFFDDDGKVYYTRRGPWGSDAIVQAEIDIHTGKLLSELREITKGMVSRDIEGPHLYKIGNLYYLMAAEGGSRALHMVTLGRSRSPWGPFEPCPHNPILAQHEAWWNPVRGAGHADLIQAHDSSWWMVYLATRHPHYDAMSHLGRETFLAPVTWIEGWPVIDPSHVSQLEITTPALPPHPWPQAPVRDDFDTSELGLYWTFLRNPKESAWTLSERPGFLRLRGEADLGSLDSPAFVGRRQEHFACSCAVSMRFVPSYENEEAGLTVFLNNRFHYDLALTVRQGRTSLVLRKTVGDLSKEVSIRAIYTGQATLVVTATDRTYRFTAWVDGKEIELGTGMTQFLGTELAGAWTGVFLAMYASGGGKKCLNPADFDWFEYSGM